MKVVKSIVALIILLILCSAMYVSMKILELLWINMSRIKALEICLVLAIDELYNIRGIVKVHA
jgi:hypothetical protein